MTNKQAIEELKSLEEDVCDEYGEQSENTIVAIEIAIDAVKERGQILHWISKFCRHIDMGEKPYTDVEAFEFFKTKMKQQFGWEVEE